MLVSLGAMVATSMACQAIPYSQGFNAKHIAWAVHSSVVGAVIAPLCLLGGPLMVRAALYTSGIVGGTDVSWYHFNLHCSDYYINKLSA